MNAQRVARGIALPVVVFLLVILSMLLAAATTLAMQGSAASALETRGTRALAAARAGTEWAAWMVNDPQATLAPGAAVLPPCVATTTVALPSPLDEFTVTVQCTRYPASGELDEGGLKLASYQLTATASAGDAASAERVERRVQTRLTVCKNPGGLGPRYPC
jgi:hypothetical protein